MTPLPQLGLGMGWRGEIAGLLAALPGLRFCEVIAESLPGGALPPPLATLRERGVSVIPHGITLSLGGAEPVAPQRLAYLAACADRLGAPLVSEHIAFVRAGGMEAGHLLPVPRSREALDVLVRNVRQAQLCARHAPPAIMLERDGTYPPAPELRAELDRIADAASIARITA